MYTILTKQVSVLMYLKYPFYKLQTKLISIFVTVTDIALTVTNCFIIKVFWDSGQSLE